MKRPPFCMRIFLPSLLTLALTTPAITKTTIVVHFGPYDSVQKAAHGEDHVNWRDADQTDNTVCTECFAALELQHYLRKMTDSKDDFAIVNDKRPSARNADLPIGDLDGDLILIGGPSSNTASRKLAASMGIDLKTFAKTLAELGQQGYRIKTAKVDGRNVTIIAGGSRMGTLYGAYDFLYRHGCRWFGLGEANEFVPQVKKLQAIDATEKPSYGIRGFRGRFDRPKPGMDFLLWMARNRLNLWSVEATANPNVTRKLGIKLACGGHTAIGLFLNPSDPYPYNHKRFDGDDSKPEDPYPQSDLYRGDADHDGRLSYFEAHPEWFAMRKKQRVKGLRGEGGANFCTSNRDAVKEFVKNHVQALIDGPYKDADMVRLWTADNGKWCGCDECKKLGNRTDRYLRLVHDFDRGIKQAQVAKKINRPITIRFLIYSDVLAPPSRPLPADFDYDTCVGTFFPIKRCFMHFFDDTTCDRNAPYQKQLHGWVHDPKRHYRGRLCIGEYYNVSRFKCLPVCYMHIMEHDIPYYYHKAGARHFHYMHCTTGNWGTKTLTNYQMARQLWDVDADCRVLWKDYFEKRYGNVAELMERLYGSLERMLCGVTELKYNLANQLQKGKKDLFPRSHLRYQREPGVKCDGTTLFEMWYQAKENRCLLYSAHNEALSIEVQERIAEDGKPFWYAYDTLNYYVSCVRSYQAVRAGKQREARKHLHEARKAAEALRKDTESASARFGSKHTSAKNAFEATLATGALERLEKLIKSAKAQK